MKVILLVLKNFIFSLFFLSTVATAELSTAIEKIKPSVVAIGTYKKTQSPPFVFRGTGFVIGTGNQVITNAHVLPDLTSPDAPELAVLVRTQQGDQQIRRAKIIARVAERDLAAIHLEGPPLPALKMGDSRNVHEGRSIAFTGFPIAGALGFSPVTHRGIISAITPIVLPSANANQLNEKLIAQIKRGTFEVFQLDATAYPGNSGSPVFDIESGDVIGVINMVFIKGSRESALTAPSGISYAIPAMYVTQMLGENRAIAQ